jgi:capsid protein
MNARLADRAQRAKLSYEAARPGRERPPPQPIRGPDNLIHQLDSIQMIARAEELARDVSFIKSIIDRFKMHVVGNLQYIPTVGTRKENALYREWWQNWCKRSDITRRFHFVDQMNHGVGGCLVQGDHGIIHHHHPDGTFQIQNVEGENIGNPRQVISGNGKIIRGVVIDDNGAPVAYQIFRQTVSSQFIFVCEVPAANFSHLNPVTRSDEYKAKTPFHAVLNDVADLRRLEKAWMCKAEWAGKKVGIINTPNGMAPMANPMAGQDLLTGGDAAVTRGRLQPLAAGEVMYGEPGMSVSMVDNVTPSAEELELMLVKLQQVAGALCLPLPYLYVMMGLPGTYTRLIGEWASRTFEDGPMGQKWLERTALNEIKNKALLSGILRDEIPWVKGWDKGQWMFPARSSVDVGRESDANLKENAQGIKSMADICAEEGRYWDDVDQELEYEAESKLERAISLAKRLSVNTGAQLTWQDVMPHIQMMGPNPTPKDPQPAAQAA